jgi:poly [ADP-ribose] polymerase
MLKDKEPSKSAIVAGTNRFYTAIPHFFALGQIPPLIDNEGILKEKTEMLDSLLDMEIANTIIKDRDANQSDPIADHYHKLKCELVPMEKTDPIYKLIEEYVANTHAKTHNQYALEVQNIFVVDREGERERFEQQKRGTNRKLLWHGSRLTNFAGILSQGLRIAPKEAPVTGYMFGKGVYFADMVSKSANYCFTTPENNTGILLLSEVVLGKMHELTGADSSIEKAPKGCLCVKGLGQTMPDPKKEVPLNPNDTHDSKVIVPNGEGVPSGVRNTSLLYNEFIVYNVNQVRLRYLLQVSFKYKKNSYY